jgi:hypothetical protein
VGTILQYESGPNPVNGSREDSEVESQVSQDSGGAERLCEDAVRRAKAGTTVIIPGGDTEGVDIPNRVADTAWGWPPTRAPAAVTTAKNACAVGGM